MAKKTYQSRGLSEKPCIVCSKRNRHNQVIQTPDRDVCTFCPTCLFDRIPDWFADGESSIAKSNGGDTRRGGNPSPQSAKEASGPAL